MASRPSAEAAAARWVARRDRVLSATEQDAYLQWLATNGAHAAALARMEHIWQQLDAVDTWKPFADEADRTSAAAGLDPALGLPPWRCWACVMVIVVAMIVVL